MEDFVMPSIGDVAFWVSLVGLLILAVRNFIRHRKVRQIIFSVILLSTCGVIYAAFFESDTDVRPKGEQLIQWPFVIILYICMLMGMALSYLYNLFSAPKKSRQPFDVGNFLAPFFASPIVFIPLLSAFQDSGVDLSNLTEPKLMIFLIGIQNGFFWKEFFKNRHKGQAS
jgi:uncharacterized membrane protein YkvI